jgi:hypothetical protein
MLYVIIIYNIIIIIKSLSLTGRSQRGTIESIGLGNDLYSDRMISPESYSPIMGALQIPFL